MSVPYVSVVERSGNSKIGVMSATYTGYQTCPATCPMLPEVRNGEFTPSSCYASLGLVGMQMRRLTRASKRVATDAIMAAEVAGIRALSGKLPLRLKVGGDTPNATYARGVAAAAKEHTAKFGQAVFGYTHSWREITRRAFGTISILASCDSPRDIARAKKRGYATATIVSGFPTGAKVWTDRLGNTLLPCPQQVALEAGRTLTCTTCKLCMKDGLLRDRGYTVAFKAHGSKAAEIKTRLVQIGV